MPRNFRIRTCLAKRSCSVFATAASVNGQFKVSRMAATTTHATTTPAPTKIQRRIRRLVGAAAELVSTIFMKREMTTAAAWSTACWCDANTGLALHFDGRLAPRRPQIQLISGPRLCVGLSFAAGAGGICSLEAAFPFSRISSMAWRPRPKPRCLTQLPWSLSRLLFLFVLPNAEPPLNCNLFAVFARDG